MKNRKKYKPSRPVLLFFTLFLILMPFGCKKSGITTEIIDGVKHVHNPAEPLKGTVDLELEEMLRIDMKDQKAEDLFVFLRFWKGPQGNVYLYDWTKKRVHQFSSKGEFLGAFCRIGQGPGEFSQWSTFSLHFVKEGEIWAIGGGKVARFDMERNFLGEIKRGRWISDAVYLDEASFVAQRSEQVEEGKEMREWAIISYGRMNKEGQREILFDYFKATDVGMIRRGRSAFADEWATPRIYWAYDDFNKRVYTVLNTEYKITSHEMSGESLFVFDKVHNNYSMDEDEREQYIKENFENREFYMQIYPDEFCAVRAIKPLPRGHLAVYSIDGVETFSIDVYDSEGRFLYVLNPPHEISLEHAKFYDFGLALREEKEDRDIYVEYKVKNLPEIFGKK
ncbi:MAG: 6-bladed beta-propeller [Candidatus Aminicenantes bacterium]|nr:MAG: 6-bladed beta-propeller [Candidatus Aminicenantes bacterium]